jgi:hypothetical protein
VRRLLEWLIGRRRPLPHIQEALDAAESASKATADARRAVTTYWQARRVAAAKETSRVIDDYQAAELARLARRAK